MKHYEKLTPKEINSQKRDLFITYRSNSQAHYKDITSFEYEHRIRLNQLGEIKTMDIRNQVPVSHIRDSFVKSELSCPKKINQITAYEKAEMEEKINFHTLHQKHQNLLKREKNIKKMCQKINKNIKKKFENRKERLKNELTRIIKDALKFSKKNNPVRSMLPDNINDIVAQVKKETQDLSLNLSRISRISRVSSLGMNSVLEKNDFLNSLGIDMENLDVNNVNIDIDKCWNYIVKIAKGRSVEDILRYKVVNIIMNLTEKKSAEKAKKIYEKLDIYKGYMQGKKNEEIRRKRMEEERKEKALKGNIKEYLKQKMYKSLSETKAFGSEKIDKNKGKYGKKSSLKKKKKFKRSESTGVTTTETNKKFKRLNAYHDVTKILNFIDNSKKNSQSKVCRNHFANIQMTKNMDISLQKMIEKNDIFK